jgi:hypothetical protein
MSPTKLGVVVLMTGPGEEQAASRPQAASRSGIRLITVTKYRIERIGSTDFSYDGAAFGKWGGKMRSVPAISVLMSLMLSGNVWSQGHPEASGEASIKIERSSEYKAEGQPFERVVSVTREYQQQGCAATLGLEYYQKGSHAHVKSTLKNEQCAASSGSYIIRVSYIPEEGEPGQAEFEETWSRDDDADIVNEKDYYLGENIDVRRVASSKLRCTCAADENEETEDATPTSE